MNKRALYPLVALVIFMGCSRVVYFPDRPIVVDQPYILAHQGGGYFDAGNTFEAVVYGLEKLDGIEIDIQRSYDNTLWLSHSPMLLPCGAMKDRCFASLTDKAIIDIDSCLGPDIYYTRLESVFAFMSANYPDKYVSLDVKAWMPCGTSVNIIKEMNQLAQKIIDLTHTYNLRHVMVESETSDFLYYIKKRSSSIETYLVTMGDFELGASRALNAGYTGISFSFKNKGRKIPVTSEQIELVHRKGLKIQLWTMEDGADLEEAIALKPDFIQTDYF
jgi:glycerophosphoryl diester phosphodiesterase